MNVTLYFYLSFTFSAVTSEPWSAEDENELRAMMSRLKAERANVQGTVVVLECLHAVDIVEPRLKGQQIRRMDLETAVLMQVCSAYALYFIKVFYRDIRRFLTDLSIMELGLSHPSWIC